MNKDLMFSSKTDLWETPQDFFDRYDALYHFETDVCALPENAKCARYFTPEQDALAYFQQLERERDAAIADLAEKPRCENCKHFTPGYFCIGCRRGERWEWRGVAEAEG